MVFLGNMALKISKLMLSQPSQTKTIGFETFQRFILSTNAVNQIWSLTCYMSSAIEHHERNGETTLGGAMSTGAWLGIPYCMAHTDTDCR